ncbi:MAG: type I restriction enzyme HsdR N-terminal domain-containing protein [Saprospiraceae bacterium]|nr:type I restriction enzyme HsdR N-terminal domain-containing protein [Saprospiraceae bacterium]
MATIPAIVKDRFVKNLKKYQAILKKKTEIDINESDTVTIVVEILENIFGYDKFNDISSEYKTSNQYCDLAIKIDDNLKFLIEVKSMKINLKSNHIDQLCNYGLIKGKKVKWLILTNGLRWKIISITYSKILAHEEILEFDFLELNTKKEKDLDKLYRLSKESLKKNALDDFHNHNQTLNQYVIGQLLLKQPVLDILRKTIKKMNPEIKCDNEMILAMLQIDLIKSEIFEDEKSSKAKKQVNKYFKSLDNAKEKPVVE